MNRSDLDRFELEGFSYYQRTRRCSKTNCKCSRGQEHGPYWYKRAKGENRTQYIGTELPEEVKRARSWHNTLFTDMIAKRREIAEQFDTVNRLISNAPLTQKDRNLLASMGFNLALVVQGTIEQPEASDQDSISAAIARL